ncbi:MAG: PIG-L family deacetylase [Candidatus Aenigmarchaeota archaeon]|nr:PIG-L family deacetylase [Candidatus Aenigmarchaeota archaeon]
MIDLKGKRIMIISPHPDDEIIGCGGLIMRSKREKADMLVVYACVGSSRQLVTGHTEEKTRLKEIEKVSKIGGFRYHIMFIGEFFKLDVRPQKEIVDKIEDLSEKYGPDIICIPFGKSYDQDHRALFSACITALRPVPRSVRHMPDVVIEYEEPYSWTMGEIFAPNFYIDLNEEDINGKVRLMKAHATQDRKDPFPRSAENLRRLAKMRGVETGTSYAEAYRILRMIVR